MIALWWIATMYVTLSAIWIQRTDNGTTFREKVENILFASLPAAFGPVLVVISYVGGPSGFAFWLMVTVVSLLLFLAGAATIASIFVKLATQGLLIFSAIAALVTAITGYALVGTLLLFGYCC